VLEIGGVKEKTLAAYRAGLREVIMPKANEKDLRDIPDEIRRTMVFTFVSTMDEVLRMTLLGAPEPLADRAVVELPGRTMGTPRSVGTIPLRPIADGGAAAIAGSVRLRPDFLEPRPRMLAEPNDPLDLSVLFQDEL
jgi:hypothetical protein